MFFTATQCMMKFYNITKSPMETKQGNYSLRRPQKLIIPQAVIKQRWASVCRFIPKLSPFASVTGGQVQIRWAGFARHREYFPCTEMGRDESTKKAQ